MAKQPILPGVSSEFISIGNPNIAVPDLGYSVLLIGTSENGPLHEPIRVTSLDFARMVFGDPSIGSLVKSYIECDNAAPGQKEVYCVRYGPAVCASLNLREAVTTDSGLYGYTEEDDVQISDAVTLTAIYPGAMGNQISIGLTVNEDDGRLYINIYDPYRNENVQVLANIIEDHTSSYVPTEGINSTAELVEFINTHPTIGQIIKATMKEITTEIFTMNLIDPEVDPAADEGVGVDVTDEYTEINLSTHFPVLGDTTGTFTDHDSIFIPDTDPVERLHIPISAANRLVEISDIEIESGCDEVKAAGAKEVRLDYYVKLGYDGYPIALLTTSGETDAVNDGELLFQARNQIVGVSDGASSGYTITTWAEIDTSANDNGTLIFKVYATDPRNPSRKEEIPSTQYTLGAYDSDANTTPITVWAVDGRALRKGIQITVDFNTVDVPLTRYLSREGVEESGSWTNYFISGRDVVFGGVLPHNYVRLRYRTSQQFEVGSDVKIHDARRGIIRFVNTSNKPALATTTGINFRLTYEPEWVDISTTLALSGGTNGTVMDNNAKYDELVTLFDKLENFPSQVVVLTDCYLDDTRESYSSETGLRYDNNAGFHLLLHDFIEEQHKNVGASIGVISIKPAADYEDGMNITLADINTWHEKATEVNSADRLRAANIMEDFTSINYNNGEGGRFVLVPCIEPVFYNKSYSTLRYVGNSAAAIAGLIAKVSDDSSLLHARFANARANRYMLSNNQVNDLTITGYIAPNFDANRALWIGKDKTCASVDSAYKTARVNLIVIDFEKDVRDAVIGDIGKGASMGLIQAIQVKLNKILLYYIDTRMLLDSKSTVTVVPNAFELNQGIITIDALLVPIKTTDYIRLKIRVPA